MADYVMVNMVAEAASGASSPADAAAKAKPEYAQALPALNLRVVLDLWHLGD